MDWGNDTVLEFLDYYKRESIIWDPLSESHKNRDLVFDAWKRISADMQDKYSIKELKKKKDSLMASFRTCNQKVKASIKSGAGTSQIYQPTWFAYQSMAKFLGDKDRPRTTINTEDTELEEALHDNREVPETDIDVGDNENEDLVLPSSSQPPKKRKRNQSEDLHYKMSEAYAILKSVTYKPKKKNNICAVFGDFVAGSLETMDEYTRDLAMHQIHTFLFECKNMAVKRKDGMSESVQSDHNYSGNVAEYVTIDVDEMIQ